MCLLARPNCLVVLISLIGVGPSSTQQRRPVCLAIATSFPVFCVVLEHQDGHGSQWAAIESIAGKIGCTAETLRNWVRRAERDQGLRPGLTTDERARMKALEREVRELRQANEILRKASASFAQAELDRRFKP